MSLYRPRRAESGIHRRSAKADSPEFEYMITEVSTESDRSDCSISGATRASSIVVTVESVLTGDTVDRRIAISQNATGMIVYV